MYENGFGGIISRIRLEGRYIRTFITIFILSITKMTLNKNMLIYWCFILAAKDVDLQKIIKVAIVIHICCMLAIIAGSIHGIIEDRIYQEGDKHKSSLGYQYTTDSSNYFFHIILMYIFLLKEKSSWKSLGILAFCNLLVYKLTENLVWMEQLNNKINGRLELGYNALKKYGIYLFGRPIEWIGGSRLYTGGIDPYNYVDSSYV